jgi:hypothetical protein
MLFLLAMKCPHCNEGIHEGFKVVQVIEHPIITTSSGALIAPAISWTASHMRCPECWKAIIQLKGVGTNIFTQFLAYPTGVTRPIPPEVGEPYRQDFAEACAVLQHSPKASAALSRRCLQAILRDKAKTKSKDLFDQIEEVLASGTVPSHISSDLHAVRNIGNFAAHTIKSTNSGAIVDVESGEAEWNLDVLESLFDFYFVQPALSAKRKAALNTKLKAAGKPEIQ